MNARVHISMFVLLISLCSTHAEEPRPPATQGSANHPMIKELRLFLERHESRLPADLQKELAAIIHRYSDRICDCHPDECKTVLAIEDFNACQPSNNLLRGESGTYHAPQKMDGQNDLGQKYDRVAPGDCAIRLPYVVKAEHGAVGYWTRLKGQDWSQHIKAGRLLCFYAKGSRETKFTHRIKAELKSGRGASSESGSRMILGITEEWQEFRIPLTEFTLSSWQSMHELVFTIAYDDLAPNDEALEGTIWLDNIRICECPKPLQNNTSPRGGGGY